MVRTKYDPKKLKQQLVFERIKQRYGDAIRNFRTYNQDLKEFLYKESFKSQRLAVTNTILVFDRSDYKRFRMKQREEPSLLGYISILNDSIRLDGSLKRLFEEKGIPYRSLPAMKIGRICVDDRFQKKGIGRCMIAWATHRAAYLNQSSACRYLTLDAKRSKDITRDPLGFYEKQGFRILVSGQTSENTTPLYLDIYSTIRKSLAKV